MGENLVINMANHGFRVSVYNRTTSKVDSFVEGRGKEHIIVGCKSVEELVESLASPKKIMFMVKVCYCPLLLYHFNRLETLLMPPSIPSFPILAKVWADF